MHLRHRSLVSLCLFALAPACGEEIIEFDPNVTTSLDEVGTDTTDTETDSTDTTTTDSGTDTTDIDTTTDSGTETTDTTDTGTETTDTGPAGDAMLRMVNLGIETGVVDLHLDQNPFADAHVGLDEGIDYLVLSEGLHDFAVTLFADDLFNALLVTQVDLTVDQRYTAVVHGYTDTLAMLLLNDDDSGIAPGATRVQVAHAAADLGQIDLLVMLDPPVQVIADLDPGASQVIEGPAGALPLGLDLDDDQIPEWTFSVPDLGADILVDLYLANEIGGAPAYLLAQHPDGSTTRIDADVCGDDTRQALELCDGSDLGGASCADLGFLAGTLACAGDCMAFDTSGCGNFTEYCSDAPLPIPDDDANGISQDIVIADVGTIADVNVVLQVSHSWLDDLDFELTASGTTVILADTLLDANDQVCGGDDMAAILDDEAGAALANACVQNAVPAISGSLTPQESLTAFDGMEKATTWTLSVADTSNKDTGQVEVWCLQIEVQ
ncbi:MAG: DUF4397 domain-containing protein [Myxococcales bacterium]|nr:DUF4397 domain-containing protein [Myxococcales bacterium]